MSDVGGPKLGLMNIGEEAKPPFAVLPTPSVIFKGRANRFVQLAAGHQLQGYLEFLGRLCQAQHEIQAGLPPAVLPQLDEIRRALGNGMPPISRDLYAADNVAEQTLVRLLEEIAKVRVPEPTQLAIERLLAMTAEARKGILRQAARDPEPIEDLPSWILATAALQVHFARQAAMLNADDLRVVADGACPVCGSAPVSSAVVGWRSAGNARFCSCSLCATMWNVVRVKCVLCSSTAGISYQTIEGLPDTVCAETCDSCHSYVKILYQVKDPGLEAVADDVATAALDMMLAESSWKRGAKNPFLIGY